MITPCPATIEAHGVTLSCGHIVEAHPKRHEAEGVFWYDPSSTTTIRLRCHYCGRFLSPDIHWTDDFPPERLPVEHYGYQGNDKFCTQRHGYLWAVEALTSKDTF